MVLLLVLHQDVVEFIFQFASSDQLDRSAIVVFVVSALPLQHLPVLVLRLLVTVDLQKLDAFY